MEAQQKGSISCNFRDMGADAWYSLLLLIVASQEPHLSV